MEELEAVRAAVRADGRATLAHLRENVDALPTASQEDAKRLLARAGRGRMPSSTPCASRTRPATARATTATITWARCWCRATTSTSSTSRASRHAHCKSAATSIRRCATWRGCCVPSTTRAGARCAARRRTPTSWHGWAPRPPNGKSRPWRAFLDGYTAALSTELGAVDPQLLSLFELEKAFYELRYEMNNRPDWVSVPMQGILAMVERASR